MTVTRSLLALSLLAFVSIGQAAGVDLLDQPAKQSRHMKESLQTAVTRAGDRLVSVGEGGLILLSDDQGATWRLAKNIPASVLLTNVQFVSPEQGWVTGHGGLVMMTTDGGETWQKQLDGTEAAKIELAQAEAATPQSDPAVQHRLREAKGLIEDGADKPLLGIAFQDALHGMVVGAYGLAFSTKDGGKSWQSMMGNIDNPRGKHLYAIIATKGGLFIAGEEGSLFRSTDGGQSFKPLKSPSRGTFFGLMADPSGALVAFGLKGDAVRSGDNGETWQKIEAPAAGLNGGTLLSDGRLAIVDDWGDVLVSDDGGRSFKAMGAAQTMGLLGIVQTKDGALAAAGTRGDVRVAITKTLEQTK